MLRNNKTPRIAGFTLIEMLAIAPIALLVIAGFVALMVTMVGDVMVTNGRNGMTYDIQGSLNMVEQDVRLSTEFLATTGTMPSPQGRNGATSAFSSGTGDLILGEIATNKNPLDATRTFVYYSNAPNACADAQQYKNRIFFTTVMYFVSNGSLWRRTFVPTAGGTLCDQPWQVNTCAPGYASSSVQCKSNDTEVMQNVSSFTVSYFTNPQDTTPIAASNAPTASTITVQINGQQNVAGRTLTATATNRTTKLSSKDITLAPPTAPTVTAQAYDPSQPGSATFTWTANPLVSYSIRYNISGGPWITAAENTKQNSITLKGPRASTITVQVSARNTTGDSGYGSGASRTIPTWETCSLQNGWANYGSPHATCGYTKTTDGIIILKGLIRIPSSTVASTANQVLFTLPTGYRPTYHLVFNASTYDPTNTNGVLARVDIQTNGEVQIVAGNNGWVSLPDIKFIPDGSLYTWTDVTFQNAWINNGGSFAPLQVAKDNSGRVHIQGLIKPGGTTASANVTQLPSGYEPPQYMHIPSYHFDALRIDGTGLVTTSGYGGSYYALDEMYYPASFASWTNLTLQNSWVTYGGVYATPQYTRSSDCIVTVKGLIKSGTVSAGTVVANLPVGYRPDETLIFDGVSNNNYYRAQIDAAGDIRVTYADATWISLNMIDFVAEDGSCP